MKKLLIILVSSCSALAIGLAAGCEKDFTSPKDLALAKLSGGQNAKKKPSTGGTTTGGTTTNTNSTGNAYLDSLYAACNMVPTDSGLIYPVVTLNNIQVTHRSIGGHDAIQITWDPLVTPGKTVAGYYFAAGPCLDRPDCKYHNNLKFSQVTTNTTGTIIVVQYGMSWLWTLNYYGCIHVLYTDNCMAMSQVFNFTGPQY